MSSASVTTILDEERVGGFIYLVPVGFFILTTASSSSSSSLGAPPPVEGARHLCCFGGYLRVCQLGFTTTIRGNISEQPPSLLLKSSLLQQQHGESRREKRREGKQPRKWGKGWRFQAPPLLQINNIARNDIKSDEKHPESTPTVRFDSIKRIPGCS